jgi:glucose-1-phosphate adenylyltransferase
MKPRVLAFVLAGGRGSRLGTLTDHRAKPAVSFGGKYRIIDFVLSNLVNSDICAIYVLVQANSHSLLRHLRDGWQFGSVLPGQFVMPVAAQLRSVEEGGYKGTADALYQNLNLVETSDATIVAIFGADHIYRMNISAMVDEHVRKGSEITVAAYPVDAELASEFGVIEADANGVIAGFHEKRPDAPRMPGEPQRVFASMGNYLFNTQTLIDVLCTDAETHGSRHDFGHDILPSLVGRLPMHAYEFKANAIPGERGNDVAYWRDVGTADAYYEAQMDLCGVAPSLNLYNRRWPIRTASYPDPAAKFTFDNAGQAGEALGSIVSGGCVLRGGTVRNSVVGRCVFVESGASVEDSILLDNCRIGPGAKIRRAIIDENTAVPAGVEIGHSVALDGERYQVTEGGVVLVARAMLEEQKQTRWAP